MKKTLLVLFAWTLGAVLTACTAFSQNTPVTTPDAFTDPLEVVAFQAASATELLTEFQNTPVATAEPLGYRFMAGESNEEPAVTEDIDVLDRYLTMMEQFLGDDNGMSVVVVESDLPEYEVKMIFTTRSLSGGDITYTMYYTETVLTAEVPENGDETITTAPEEEIEPTEPIKYKGPWSETPREEPFNQDSDDDSEEVVSLLEGLLIIGDRTYQLEGRKIRDGEEEIMILHSFLDSNNEVRVRYMIDAEDGDKKFFYEAKVDGTIVSRSKVKIQIEDGKRHVRLEFLDDSGKGRYDFQETTEDNITYIKIRYSIETAEGEERGMIHIRATYDEVTGLTTYEYMVRPENGCGERQFEKEHKGHHGNGHGGNQPDNEEEEAPAVENGSESEDDTPLVSGDDIFIG